MIDRRKVSIVIIAASVAAQMVFADLMPVCGQETGGRGTVCRCGRCEQPETGFSCLFGDSFRVFALGAGIEEAWPERETGGAEASEIEHYQGLTEGSTSFDLCLYALVGLGLFRSGHWVRRSSLGFVPDWYHSGGPFQIGHSHALAPGALCPMPVYCFVQPDHTEQDHRPQCRLGTLTPLWSKSQFTPLALAPRGPPLCFC